MLKDELVANAVRLRGVEVEGGVDGVIEEGGRRRGVEDGGIVGELVMGKEDRQGMGGEESGGG